METKELEKSKQEAEKEQALAIRPGQTLSPMGAQGIELRDMADLWRFASWAMRAGFAPAGCKNPEAAALIVQYGLELGLSPMSSLQNIYIINNKPSIYGHMGLALCQASGELIHYKEYINGEKEEMTAFCEIQRKGDKEKTIKSFSVADAKIAELWATNNWKKYPKDMLQYKASWRALYARFADVLKGVIPREFAEEYRTRNVVDALAEDVPEPELAECEEAPKSKSDELAERLEKKAASIKKEEEPLKDNSGLPF